MTLGYAESLLHGVCDRPIVWCSLLKFITQKYNSVRYCLILGSSYISITRRPSDKFVIDLSTDFCFIDYHSLHAHTYTCTLTHHAYRFNGHFSEKFAKPLDSRGHMQYVGLVTSIVIAWINLESAHLKTPNRQSSPG